MMYYTGIGSRRTPANVLAEMTTIARNLELTGFTLRSGGAAGADSAFEAGVEHSEHKNIYLPWKGFNRNDSTLCDPTPDAFDMAAEFHPAWGRCSPAARKFHARNCFQVLGYSLTVPSDCVICWTPGGEAVGGTGQALRLAAHHGIPIFNMGNPSWERPFKDWMKWLLNEPANFGLQGESDA